MGRPKKNRKNQPTPASVRDQILADFATLRVPVTAEQLDEALKQAQNAGWSHLEFLHRLLADQAGLRRQRRIERLIKEAHFREALPLGSFDWNFNPAIPRLKIEALAQGETGFFRASEEHGPTALYGGIIRTLGMDREAIATSFRAILEDITSGGFAARFQEEAKNGYPMLNVAKAMVQEASPISIAEDRLRRLRGR